MKIIMPIFRRKSMYVKLIIYFALIIIITLSISSYFTYTYFSESFKDEITGLNHKVLNQVSIFSDEFLLRRVNEMALGTIMDSSRNYYTNEFLYNPNFSRSEILSACKSLDNIMLENRDVVDSIFLHSRESQTLISPTLVKSINEQSAANSEEFNWISTFYNSGKSVLWFQTRNAAVYSNSAGYKGDIITVVYSYPLSATGKDIKGCLAVNIKEDALSGYLQKLNSMNFGKLLIINSLGEIISHSDKTSLYSDISKESFVREIISGKQRPDFMTAFNGVKYVVSYIKSSYNKDWYYISMVPAELFYQRDYYIKKNIFIVSAIVLFLVFILSNVFSLKIYNPLKRILKKHLPSADGSSENSADISEFKLLDNMFDSMSNKISMLQSTLENNASLIRHNYLNDLLNGRINDTQKLNKLLKVVEVSFSRKHYYTILFTISIPASETQQQESIQLYKYSILDFINAFKPGDYSLVPVDCSSGSICVIVNTGRDEQEEAEYFITAVQSYCLENYGFNPTASTGKVLDDLASINESYIDALKCIQYKFIRPEQNIFNFKEINKIISNASELSQNYFKNLEVHLKHRDYEEIEKLLEAFRIYISANNITCLQARKEATKFTGLLRSYIENLNASYEEIVDEVTRDRLSHLYDIREYIEAFLLASKNLFIFLSYKKLNKNAGLVEMVKEYVQSNLNTELSLNSTAEAFHISPFYLSKIFKDETGMNYIEFVVSCKMNLAKELLTSTNLSIEKITMRVGYRHSTYFSRKFKQLNGMTPNEYRCNPTLC